MANIDQVKQRIQEYFGSRGKISDRKTGIVNNLASPKSIGLFFSISSKEELNTIRSLLKHVRQSRESVKAYVFSMSRERIDVITDQSIVYFDLNDFTLFGRKQEQIEGIFVKDRSELLISFLLRPEPFVYRIVSDLNAEFKVGPNLDGFNDIYDLVLDVEIKKFNFIKFYDQVMHYLTVLNIKTR